MDTQQISFGISNIISGILVITSYVHGIKTNPDISGDAWEGVPSAMKPL